MHRFLRFGIGGHNIKREIRSGRHAPGGRLGNLSPHGFVGPNHIVHQFVTALRRDPAPECNLGSIIGRTLLDVHIPAIRVSHQVPAAVQAIEFPHDFRILGAGRFANHQRIAFGRTIPEAASGIGIFAVKGAVLPVVTHRVLFIPPVERGIASLYLLLVEGGQRNHLPATRSGLDFRGDFEVFLSFGMSCTVVHHQDHFVLADRSRSQFPLATANNRILKGINPNGIFSANHKDACDCRFTDVFGTEGQADCIVAGLFNGRLHNLDFIGEARARGRNAARAFGFTGARNFDRTRRFFGTAGTFGFARTRNFDRTRGFRLAAGTFGLARARNFDRTRRFRKFFVGGLYFDTLGNHIEFTVPAHKSVAFTHRVSRRHGRRAVFHHLNVTNLGIIVIQEGYHVLHLGRIVNSLVDGIALDPGHFRIPAHKGVHVFSRSSTRFRNRRQHNRTVFNGIASN